MICLYANVTYLNASSRPCLFCLERLVASSGPDPVKLMSDRAFCYLVNLTILRRIPILLELEIQISQKIS